MINIGGGNMARSLIGGLTNSGVSPGSLYVSDPSADSLKSFKDDFGINTSSSNQALLDSCDIIVLAVKPQVMKDVVSSLSISADKHPLLITIAAGIRVESQGKLAGRTRLALRRAVR